MTGLADEDKLRPRDNQEDASWVAEASHELRLPIANLRLLMDTLLDGALEDKETCRKMITRAGQEVDRLQKLVVDLLSAEQVGSSKYELRCQWLSLKERAGYVVDTTSALASSRNIQVEVVAEPDFQIYAHPEQLDQVLLNLVENAIKFTPEGGQVWVRSGPGPGCFQVADTGIGMAQTEIPKIFQRFYRIDRARCRGSTGLGLSIVKHIVDLHGAKINVTSKEDRGSVFTLEFPGPAA